MVVFKLNHDLLDSELPIQIACTFRNQTPKLWLSTKMKFPAPSWFLNIRPHLALNIIQQIFTLLLKLRIFCPWMKFEPHCLEVLIKLITFFNLEEGTLSFLRPQTVVTAASSIFLAKISIPFFLYKCISRNAESDLLDATSISLLRETIIILTEFHGN